MLDYFFTKQLRCRKININDVDIISKWSNNPEAYGEFLAMERLAPIDVKEKINSGSFWNQSSKTFLIELKKKETPIGTLKYWTKSNDTKTALIAIKIAETNYRKKGYGTESQKGLIRELFKKYNYDSIEMYTDIGNIAQQRCLIKLDFQNIKQEDYDDAGIKRQGYLYRLTKNRYETSGVHIYYYE